MVWFRGRSLHLIPQFMTHFFRRYYANVPQLKFRQTKLTDLPQQGIYLGCSKLLR